MITREQIEVFRRVYTRKLATSTGVDREVVEAMLSMMDLALVGLAAEAADKALRKVVCDGV